MIYTASWSALFAAQKAGQLDVQPVRISLSVPRFWPAASSFPAIEALMPDGWMMRLQGEEFAAAYRRKLDGIGAYEVGRQLDEIAESCGRPLALACFEKPGPDGVAHDCHRGPLGFSGWWRAHGGEIHELQFEQLAEPVQLALDLDQQIAPATVSGGHGRSDRSRRYP